MEGALARLQTEHPDLMALINAHPEEFWQVLNGDLSGALMAEGDEEEDDEEEGTGEEEAGAALTDADEAAIDRVSGRNGQ
jgi:nucleosome binding factor SPN SPT16 subunit